MGEGVGARAHVGDYGILFLSLSLYRSTWWPPRPTSAQQPSRLGVERVDKVLRLSLPVRLV